MAYIVADNIISPLGKTTEQNLFAVEHGQSALCTHAAQEIGVGYDFVSSILGEVEPPLDNEKDVVPHFERKVLASVKAALQQVSINVGSPRTLLVLSTTKGNIEELHIDTLAVKMQLGRVAECIARRLGLSTKPIVVCNACISGLAALILAQRLVDQQQYDHVIVCGTDDIGRFVVSGFQSLNALSPHVCRPFDIERSGLNLGEAVATAIVSNQPTSDNCWTIDQGIVRNDAYHISAPSKQAEGQYQCLTQLLEHTDKSTIDFINLHGTATLFNDQMESVAIDRAALSSVPVNAYKGYYGHTLGAAGVLETVLSIHAAEAGVVLPTRGYEDLGVSGKVNISNAIRPCLGKRFVKTISGFGGCNASALLTRHDGKVREVASTPRTLTIAHHLVLTPKDLTIDGLKQSIKRTESTDILVNLYKSRIGDYPKFYKMDALSRLGFMAAELLVKAEGREEVVENNADTRAVVFFNAHSSLAADRKYLESIADSDNYFPSPAAFVYTLPNIVTGEVAIRHGYHGETSFYILPDRDEALMQQVLQATTADGHLRSIIAGWVDYVDADHFLADVGIYSIS